MIKTGDNSILTVGRIIRASVVLKPTVDSQCGDGWMDE